ncbi:MAG: malate synthase A [Planctomycetes bacterium]|nr:malate synthase A [Planctomycetota bacterium]
MSTWTLPPGVEIEAPLCAAAERILTREALQFVANLQRRFEPERQRRLAARREVQARLERGWTPDFLHETRGIRAAHWRVAPLARDLERRLVEITGPVERKMVINALNSGADTFMADFEDSNSPTWRNCIEGQLNLCDAVRRTISFQQPDGGKRYELAPHTATLIVRPRGWHLDEAHVRVDGRPVSASLFDFGLYFFHNARELVARGSGPYFYLPKMESHLEARLWNDVFLAAQAELALPRGTIRATVLIETILAAFEMDEILYELREHSSGLNCGRWDYIFSFIKKFSSRADFVLPDRWRVTMAEHFLRSYSTLLIRTCHRRGAHAMGGMAAFIPIKSDPERNAAALAKVAADKRREAEDGHDGTWVAHPGLVATARAEFERVLAQRPHQLERLREDVEVRAADLLRVPAGAITEAGLRSNVRIGVQYLAAWLAGSGCVPLEDLMEDAATAEISRAQVWQWLRHGARLEDGRALDAAFVARVVAEELQTIRAALSEATWRAGHHQNARALFESMLAAPEFPEFLTLPAYRQLLSQGD